MLIAANPVERESRGVKIFVEMRGASGLLQLSLRITVPARILLLHHARRAAAGPDRR